MEGSKSAQIQSERFSPWRDKKGIAAYYGCSVRHITNQQRKRKIPYCKFGGRRLFYIPDCDAALKRNEVACIASFPRR